MRLIYLCALATLPAFASCATTIGDKERATARIRYDIGVESMSQGDMRAALRELLGAVELDPALPQAHNALGLVFHSMGRLDDALTHYREAVRLDPKFSEAQNNLGVLLLDLERYDEAIAAFRIALSDILYATPFLAEGNLGWAYYRKGEVEQGLHHLRNAVATNPKFCRGYGWLAQIELARQQPDQVVAYCRRFEKHCLADVNIAPGIPPAFQRELQYYLGRGYALLGEREKAKEAFAACAAPGVESDIVVMCTHSLQEID